MPWGLRWIEVAVNQYGRKFAVTLFAGFSGFLVAVLGVWVIARVGVETARVVEQVVNGYLLAAAGLVTAYSASNAVVERAHAHHAVPPRASGSVQSGETV